jgi:hypothetical protein
MNAKTAIEILRREFKLIDKSLGLKPIPIDVSKKIAYYIEQQEKYAELGRLAVEAIDKYETYYLNTRPCASSNTMFIKCRDRECEWTNFCQLRAELLKVEG